VLHRVNIDEDGCGRLGTQAFITSLVPERAAEVVAMQRPSAWYRSDNRVEMGNTISGGSTL
jgi:hypothetical protein